MKGNRTWTPTTRSPSNRARDRENVLTANPAQRPNQNEKGMVSNERLLGAQASHTNNTSTANLSHCTWIQMALLDDGHFGILSVRFA